MKLSVATKSNLGAFLVTTAASTLPFIFYQLVTVEQTHQCASDITRLAFPDARSENYNSDTNYVMEVNGRYGSGWQRLQIHIDSEHAQIVSDIRPKPLVGAGVKVETYWAEKNFPLTESLELQTRPDYWYSPERSSDIESRDVRADVISTVNEITQQFKACLDETILQRFFRTAEDMVPAPFVRAWTKFENLVL